MEGGGHSGAQQCWWDVLLVRIVCSSMLQLEQYSAIMDYCFQVCGVCAVRGMRARTRLWRRRQLPQTHKNQATQLNKAVRGVDQFSKAVRGAYRAV